MAKQNFCVARVETRTRASVGKFERHIERKNESYENMNVDLSRTPMNVSFKGCGELTYNETLDRMIAAGTVSLKGLKPDATVFNEMIMDVNTDYFEQHGGYEYACRFYEVAFHFAENLYGKDNIISAVMHADELNIAMTEKYGRPIYHYHLHIMALPVVDKEVRWTKRCKDPTLVGTVKEVIHQVSHSKKWPVSQSTKLTFVKEDQSGGVGRSSLGHGADARIQPLCYPLTELLSNPLFLPIPKEHTPAEIFSKSV